MAIETRNLERDTALLEPRRRLCCGHAPYVSTPVYFYVTVLRSDTQT